MPFLGDRGLDRIGRMEKNNYKQGRSGSKVPLLKGPVPSGRDLGKNSTQGGGINRATRGTGAGKKEQ